MGGVGAIIVVDRGTTIRAVATEAAIARVISTAVGATSRKEIISTRIIKTKAVARTTTKTISPIVTSSISPETMLFNNKGKGSSFKIYQLKR